MKIFVVVFCALFAAASADTCYKNADDACSKSPLKRETILPNCNATYGGFADRLADLQEYATDQLEVNFEFLLMSSYFGNYKVNRDGFKALYRKMADQAWEDGIDLIKYIAKRGGKMNFGQRPKHKRTDKWTQVDLEQRELNSLALALDTQKRLAEETLRMHARATHNSKQDGSVAHYLEERFMEPQADCVRNLAGHFSDLKQLLCENQDASVSLFIFDEYLQKTI